MCCKGLPILMLFSENVYPELRNRAVIDIAGTRHRLKRPVNIIDVGLKADVSTGATDISVNGAAVHRRWHIQISCIATTDLGADVHSTK